MVILQKLRATGGLLAICFPQSIGRRISRQTLAIISHQDIFIQMRSAVMPFSRLRHGYVGRRAWCRIAVRAGSDVAFMKREIVSVQAGGWLARRMAVHCYVSLYVYSVTCLRSIGKELIGPSWPQLSVGRYQGNIFNIFNVSHGWITRPLFPVSSRVG